MLNKSNRVNQNPQCCGKYDCNCQTCTKQLQIIQMLDKKTFMQWFGKKKMQHLPSSYSTIIKTQSISQEQCLQMKKKMKAKKNEQSNKNINQQYINIHSIYLQSYKNKFGRKSDLCSPKHQISLQEPIQQIRSVYGDCYKKLPFYELDKSMKPAQVQFNLPFLGTSSYKRDYQKFKNSKSNFVSPRPKDNIVDRDINIAFQYSEKNKPTGIIKRPPSPIIQKDNQVQSKALPSNYDTSYQTQFSTNKTEAQKDEAKKSKKEQQKYHSDFLRKSKFGSLSKNRWIRQKVRQKSLDYYI